jgi:uncharacterized delta-60 repeat protein
MSQDRDRGLLAADTDIGVSLAIQHDGKTSWEETLISRMTADPPPSSNDLIVARFDARGDPDPSFNQGATATIDFHSLAADFITRTGVAVQPDHKVLLVVPTRTATQSTFGLASLNADGTLDTGFGAGGEVVTPFLSSTGTPTASVARSMLLQNGKIVLTGVAGGSFALARYLGENTQFSGPIASPSLPVQ